MKYDIYFHGGCFDGVASAAILKYFLNLRGDDFRKYIPMTHPIDKNEWKKNSMKNPSSITDILYHPKAAIWFDHHPTAFMDKKWKKNFRKDKWHAFDISSPSCSGLIYRHFTKYLKIKAPKYIKDLAHWADITDSANFVSPKAAFDMKPPAMQIGFYLDSADTLPASRQKLLINLLSKKALDKVANQSWLKKDFLKYKKKLEKSLKIMKNKLVFFKNTVFLENLKRELTGTRFAPYYFYPKSNYSIRLSTRGKFYVVSAGLNKWNPPKRQANIGNFLKKNYNQISAGGHSFAGSASFKTKKEALEAIPKIIAYLNKHV